jgi:peroxiredoxin
VADAADRWISAGDGRNLHDLRVRNRMMMRLYFSLILALCLLGCSSPQPDSTKSKKYDIREKSIENKASDFVLKDLKGADVKLSDYRNKPVLLVFSTTWCRYCRDEIPHIKKLHADYGRKDLEIINIFVQEPAGKVAAFAEKYDLPYRVVLDSDGQVAERYDVRGVPTIVLIDREGRIVCYACRSIDTILKDVFPG